MKPMNCRRGLRLEIWVLLLCSMLLSACSLTLHSEVRIKQQWPAQAAPQSYAFASVSAREEGDEQTYQQFLQLLRPRLQALGFTEVAAGADMQVVLQVAQYAQSVYQLDDVMFASHGRLWRTWARGPFLHAPLSSWNAVYWGPYFGPHYGPYFGPWHSPGRWYAPSLAYDPWHRRGLVYVYRESPFPNMQRRLRLALVRNADQQILFEALVDNETRDDHLERVLGFMLDGALEGFPGVNGSVRQFSREFK
ncbi:DUF4136 domain-containing protein [Massilia sp. W12]|uniref:DUF4136 domain-containing protein n=1 Tax=Massilia sp. W12 TaxID=3126507 RepID=UPI0030CD41E7